LGERRALVRAETRHETVSMRSLRDLLNQQTRLRDLLNQQTLLRDLINRQFG